MYINSPGGVITAGLAIYDTMRSLRCPIATTCVGLAASFGTILLMAGDPGSRYALPHARIHIHQPLMQGGLGGQVTDIDIHAREMLHTRDVINDIIALHTGQPLERIRHDTERDFFMSAEGAQEYGIVDEVLPLEDWHAPRHEGHESAGTVAANLSRPVGTLHEAEGLEGPTWRLTATLCALLPVPLLSREKGAEGGC